MSRKLIIPAAGIGSRVGRPEAKEMLLRPVSVNYADQPMIELALQVGAAVGARPHVITREDKLSLLKYLYLWRGSGSLKLSAEVDVQLVPPTREWPDTILLSQKHWGDFNVVCLPDTDFNPVSLVGNLFEALETGSDFVFATFEADNYSTWGVVAECDSEGGSVGIQHCEKPSMLKVGTRAWGLFGFRKKSGEALLNQLLASTFDHKWRTLPGTTKLLSLESFADLTR